MWRSARYDENGYEVSSRGDTRFSPLFARLKDGRLIEEAYQLDVKGYRRHGSHWVIGKGKPPLDRTVDLWGAYLALWRQWADENPALLAALAKAARGRVLTDRHATHRINQAHALAVLLNERHPC